MDKIGIYHSDGDLFCEACSPEYNGTFMGERTVTVNMKSPTEIPFAIGDYLDYRGERFTLYLLPEVSKTAREQSYGGAIEYKNVIFQSVEEELRRCVFLDVVADDNGLHYTLLPNFSFYCEKPSDLASRIQANLDRQYPGEWTVKAADDTRFADGVNLSFNNNTCWDALTQVNTNDDIDMNFIVLGSSKTIVIGGVGETLDVELKYGKGNGLMSIERTVNTQQAVVSRLYAYGNSRNLPYRYYNRYKNQDSPIYTATKSAYIPNLMLPGMHIGWEGKDATEFFEKYGMQIVGQYTATGDEVFWDSEAQKYYYLDASGNKCYTDYSAIKYNHMRNFVKTPGEDDSYYCDRVWIDSVDAQTEFGVLEGVKYFDGSDKNVEDVYPSVENFDSAIDLAAALDPQCKYNTTYNFYNPLTKKNWESTAPLGTLCELAKYEPGNEITDDGNIPEEQTGAPTFDIIIKNLGFDPNDTELKADDTPRISMKSGMCVGREFKILSSQKMVYPEYTKEWEVVTDSNKTTGPWGYKLRCEVAADESINQYFPNGSFYLSEGDKFVILGINMPSVYVDVAERKLLKHAILYLSENDHTKFNLTPKIDNIYFAKNTEYASRLKEGNILHITGTGLGIDESLPISSLKITNQKEIPEYKVTLSDDQEASLLQRVGSEIKQIYPNIVGSGSSSLGSAVDGSKYLKRGGDESDGEYNLEVVKTSQVRSRNIENGAGFAIYDVDPRLDLVRTGVKSIDFLPKTKNLYFDDDVTATETLTYDKAFTFTNSDDFVSVRFLAGFVKSGKWSGASTVGLKVYSKEDIKMTPATQAIAGADGGDSVDTGGSEVVVPGGSEAVSPGEDVSDDTEWTALGMDGDCFVLPVLANGLECTYSIKAVFTCTYRRPAGETSAGASLQLYLKGNVGDGTKTEYQGASQMRCEASPDAVAITSNNSGWRYGADGVAMVCDGNTIGSHFGAYRFSTPVDFTPLDYELPSDDVAQMRHLVKTLLDSNDASVALKPVEALFAASILYDTPDGLISGVFTVRSTMCYVDTDMGRLHFMFCVAGTNYHMYTENTVSATDTGYKFKLVKF